MTSAGTIEQQPKQATPHKRGAWLRLDAILPFVILTAFVGYFCYWNRIYFSAAFISGWDLPGQIAAVDRMMVQIPHFRYTFYDPGWFFGWGLDQFYAPFYHIVTAILAIVIANFKLSPNPAQLATHIGLGFGCACLPYSMWYFLLPFAKAIKKADCLSALESSFLALSIGFFSFWFLNHDNQFYGLGWASVMEIGLYTQTLGWHLMLLHGGALARVIDTGERKSEVWAIIFYGLLFFTHSLTALFELGVTILLALWYQRLALRFLRIQALGIALTAFWLFPALAFNKTYTVLSTIKGSGDLLELIYRYPLSLLLRHIKSCFEGHYQPIDFGVFVVGAAFLLYIPLKNIHRCQLAIAFFVTIMFAMFFSSSEYLAKSFQVTVHYYRFLGDEFLYLNALLALVPLAVPWLFKSKNARMAATVSMFLVLFGGLYSNYKFPMVDRPRMIENNQQGPPATQVQVLDYLAGQPEKGRVFFEIFEDETKHGFLAAHYMESHCFKDTGFESANGLFIESANNYRLVVTSANYLGAHAWATSQIFGNDKDSSAKQVMRQLKEFGITHIVCGADSPFFHKLQENNCILMKDFIGPYVVVKIDNPPTWRIRPADRTKTLVGYIDRAGTLPYEYFQAYIYTRDALSSAIDCIDFTGRKVCPNVPIVVVNTGEDTSAMAFPPFEDPSSLSKTKLFRVNYSHYDVIDHYHVFYQENPDYDAYNEVVKELERVNFPAKILKLRETILKTNPPTKAPKAIPEFIWSKDYQTITLRKLVPGEIYKLDYTYYPFWHSKQTEIFKGSNEQIYLLPQAEEVQLVYDQWVSPYYCAGVAVSIFTVLSLFFYSRLIEFGNGIIAMLSAFICSPFKKSKEEAA